MTLVESKRAHWPNKCNWTVGSVEDPELVTLKL